MDEMKFLNTALLAGREKVVFVILSKKHFFEAMNYAVEKLALNNKPIVLVASLKKTLNIAALQDKKNIFLINACGKEENNSDYFVESPSNLTDIQIGIEKGLVNRRGEKMVFIDSLGEIEKNVSEKNIQRFMYVFSNKLKLNSIPGIIFAISDELSEETVSLMSQFCDKTFDYSKILLESIDLD